MRWISRDVLIDNAAKNYGLESGKGTNERRIRRSRKNYMYVGAPIWVNLLFLPGLLYRLLEVGDIRLQFEADAFRFNFQHN